MGDDDHDNAGARATFCRLLAACYYEPGPEFAEEKVFDAMREAARRIDEGLATRTGRLGESFSTDHMESLLVDYTRLFLGPTQALASPYGSVWLGSETSLMQDSSMAVLALYQEGGFEIDETFRELPDHVAAELEFLYLLIFREGQMEQMSRGDELAKTVSIRRRFLDAHLGTWIGPFTAAMEAGSASDFYRELAGVTKRFVELEAARLSA
jgi:TorA maturation chaperone TorD